MDSLRILVADDHETILFRALPGDVPRVKTCRHTFSPPEAQVNTIAAGRDHGDSSESRPYCVVETRLKRAGRLVWG
jgi:hypothetical protein